MPKNLKINIELKHFCVAFTVISVVVFYCGRYLIGSVVRPLYIPVIWIGFLCLASLVTIYISDIGNLKKSLFLASVALFVISNIYGFFAGIAGGNSLRYLISDTAAYIVLPSGYIVGRKMTEHVDVSRIAKALVLVVTLFFLVDAGVGNEVSWPPIVLYSALVMLVFNSESKILTGAYLCLAILFVYLAIWSGRRGPIGMVVIVSLIIVFSKTNIWRGIIILSTFAAIFATSLSLLEIREVQSGMERVSSTSINRRDMSTYNRVLEARDILGEKSSGSMLYFLAGEGNGAVWEEGYASPNSPEVESGVHHNIHAGPVGLYYRQGLIGMFAFSLLLVSFFKIPYSYKKVSFKTGDRVITNTYIVFASISIAYVAYFFVVSKAIATPFLGVCLGYLDTYSSR